MYQLSRMIPSTVSGTTRAGKVQFVPTYKSGPIMILSMVLTPNHQCKFNVTAISDNSMAPDVRLLQYPVLLCYSALGMRKKLA